MIKYFTLFCILLFPLHAKEYSVLGIGSPALDYTHLVDDTLLKKLALAKGGWKEADSFFFWGVLTRMSKDTLLVVNSGGSALNTMRGLASLGVKTAITGHLGLDEGGAQIAKILERARIGSYCIKNESPTSAIACLITPDGKHSFCSYTEGEKTMSFQDLKQSYFNGVDLVHVEGFRLINDIYVETAMKMGQKAGATISFTLSRPALGEKYRERVLGFLHEYVDILFLNCEEAYALTHLESEKACRFLNNYCHICVITDRDLGCWVGSTAEVNYYPLHAPKVVDLKGGDDLFISGFLYGILRQAPLSKCAHLGNLLKSVAFEEYGSVIPEEKWPAILEKFSL